MGWRAITWAPGTAGAGSLYQWDGNTGSPAYNAVPLLPGALQAQEDSGEDWWYGHCNYQENGQHVGYIAVGYVGWLNWGFTDANGCYDEPLAGPPDPKELETFAKRKNVTRQAMARFDLEGNMIWCRAFMGDALYDVVQDPDGYLVAVGATGTNKLFSDMTAQPIRYNPYTLNDPDISLIDCAQQGLGSMTGKMSVVKVDGNGNLIWSNIYGAEDGAPIDWWNRRALGSDLVVRQVPGGFTYFVVGYANNAQSSSAPGFMVELDPDGLILQKGSIGPGNAAFGVNGVPAIDTDDRIALYAADKITVGGVDRIVLSGEHYIDENNQQAVVMLMDAQNPLTIEWLAHTGATGFFPGTGVINTQIQSSQGVCFAQSGGQTSVVWPVLANFVPLTTPAAGRSIAQLKVFHINLDGTLDWQTDLGEIRAYDLQAEAIQTADGNIAVLSTKWLPGYDQGNPYRWNDLDQSARDCLNNDFSDDPDTNDPNVGPFDWVNSDIYDFWQTDAYVAKLDLASGALLWETQFDAEPGKEQECFPGNLKRQECLYKITEAADGSLVVSGNTGGNFDDSYLALLKGDCQSKVDYTTFDGLNYPGVPNTPYDDSHFINGNVTWSTSMNVHGKVIVQQGATLNITNGAVISFADSKQLAFPNQLVVEAGGTLNMTGGARLTHLSSCPGSMWDGILVQGDSHASQNTYTAQAHVNLSGNATIEHARVGVLIANDHPDSYTMQQLNGVASGGIVRATAANFHNNIRDVVFSPYENHTTGNPPSVITNLSYFKDCTFMTDNTLADATQVPKQHMYLTGVRGLVFQGCTFSNQTGGSPYANVKDLGVGILSENSTFSVMPYCSIILPLGQECPNANAQRSSFSGLTYGILACTFDLSRTFVVDRADFALNMAGIRMEGMQDAGITRCTFDAAEPPLEGWLPTSTYGLYSDQCTGYEIEENTFTTTQHSGQYSKVGMVIKDSGPYYNTFYNNTFENLYTGSIIEGKNATSDETIGLEVKCNDYGLAEANAFDVALTGSFVRVQASQGTFIANPGDQNEWSNPAGNRFSLLHNGTGHPEEDWFVEDLSTFVEYFHHTPTVSDRTRPDYRDLSRLLPNDQFVTWPTDRNLACPSRLESGGHEVKRLAAEAEHGEYGDSKDAYDATKDDGDTYSLLGYVSDPAHSSAQVRNALQSVAPKVSADVWQAAFERSPAMSAWHITQALLSNSPLQGEVLKMVDYYALPEPYASLVYSAQSGDVNILSLLQSAMAIHGGAKSEALSDLGRMTWLDSLNLDPYLDSLLLIHDELPAWNSALTESGVLAAKGQYSALEVLAQNEALSGESPELYDLLKRFAEAEQISGWEDVANSDLAWLELLAAQRDVHGSAQANAWLHALGQDMPEEIIILPGDGPKSMGQRANASAISWVTGLGLEVFPNPSAGMAFVAYEVPEGMTQAELRVLDVHGRVLQAQWLAEGFGLTQLSSMALAAGVYMIDLRLDGQSLDQTKLIVQR